MKSAAGRVLPLRLGRKFVTHPLRIGLGILIGDVDDRMVLFMRDAAARSTRMSPIGSGDQLPPLSQRTTTVQIGGWDEDDGTRYLQFGRCRQVESHR